MAAWSRGVGAVAFAVLHGRSFDVCAVLIVVFAPLTMRLYRNKP
jgi:hypothetical protein